MSVETTGEGRAFSLHTNNTTYQMMVDQYGYLIHLYYGAKTTGTMSYLLDPWDRGGAGQPHGVEDRTYSLDCMPQEFPFSGGGDFRSPMLVVRDVAGAFGCDLRYVRHEVREGKYGLPGLPAVYDDGKDAQTFSVTLADKRLGLEVELLYGVLPAMDVITRAAIVRNVESSEFTVEKLQTACLDFPAGQFDVISFHGRHCMERVPDRHTLGHGTFAVGSRRGASSHQYNPFLILADTDVTETGGRCWAMSFVWSGGFEAQVERAQYDSVRMQMGLAQGGFSYPLATGESLVAPEVIMTYAADGLDRMSNNLHRCIRRHVCRGPWRDDRRPVIINDWEAFHMDFDGADILGLAQKASDLGIDMLVLDDGWFGSRDDDRRALGDWKVNEQKLGMSLGALAKRVNDLGLRFGLWFEPEMVNEDSDLYRTHPDWALALPGKDPVTSRDQLVLDFTRPEVRDGIFGQMCEVLDNAHVEYLKWDFNRFIVDAYSATEAHQGRVLYDYVLGLYDLLERLIGRYPDMLIEGCAGGGGRYDAGMLYYTPQIWTSDNTDPIDRLTIQYGTSFGYPASTMGAHVSASPNEHTHRKTPLATRGLVAMQGGGFGYELDLRKLTDAECEEVRRQVEEHRKIEALVREGDLHRLSSPLADDACSWEFVSQDGGSVLVNSVVMRVEAYGITPYVRLRGLTPGATYRDVATGQTYGADALMDMGYPLPHATREYEGFSRRFERV